VAAEGRNLGAVRPLLRGLERRAHAHAQTRTAGRLRVGRWLVAVAWVMPYLVAVTRAVVVDSEGFDPIWNGSAAFVALAGVAVLVYVAVVLARETGVPPTQYLHATNIRR
jgi:hypothetical protein